MNESPSVSRDDRNPLQTVYFFGKGTGVIPIVSPHKKRHLTGAFRPVNKTGQRFGAVFITRKIIVTHSENPPQKGGQSFGMTPVQLLTARQPAADDQDNAHIIFSHIIGHIQFRQILFRVSGESVRQMPGERMSFFDQIAQQSKMIAVPYPRQSQVRIGNRPFPGLHPAGTHPGNNRTDQINQYQVFSPVTACRVYGVKNIHQCRVNKAVPGQDKKIMQIIKKSALELLIGKRGIVQINKVFSLVLGLCNISHGHVIPVASL